MTTLYRIDPKANMARFYATDIQPTLFGEWTLTREWGRIGSRSQALMQTFPTASSAASASKNVLSAKQKRGYVNLKGSLLVYP